MSDRNALASSPGAHLSPESTPAKPDEHPGITIHPSLPLPRYPLTPRLSLPASDSSGAWTTEQKGLPASLLASQKPGADKWQRGPAFLVHRQAHALFLAQEGSYESENRMREQKQQCQAIKTTELQNHRQRYPRRDTSNT